MKKLHAVAVAALLATPVAFAAEQPIGAVAGHVTMFDADFDDAAGFGIRGWMSVGEGGGFVHGEYSLVGLENPGTGADVDVNELRMGGGMMGSLQQNAKWLAKLEYIDFGSDLDSDGFGLHGGAMFEPAANLGLFGTVGFIDVGDDDGLEFNIGGKFSFTRDLAGIIDYRSFSGDFVDVTEIRFALAYMLY
jgi:hypothetical protein